MFIRFVTIAGDEATVDAALEFLEKAIRPEIEASAGNEGFATLVAADRGFTVGASYWSDDVSMEVAEEALAPLRRQAVALTGGTLRTEEYEIAAVFRRRTPAHDAVAELARFELDVTSLDRVLAIFNEDSVRRLGTAAGFCCAQLLIDREFGHGMLATSWDDESSLRSFRSLAGEQRTELIRAASVTVLQPELYRLGGTFPA